MIKLLHFLFSASLILICIESANQQPVEREVAYDAENWMMRFDKPQAKEFFTLSTSPEGFAITTSNVKPESQGLYVIVSFQT